VSCSIVHIVDDDPQVRASTSFLLRSLGYSTEIYANGVEFLQEARLESGCILLDLRMPMMDGLEVQAELVKRGVTMPLIIFSGHGDVGVAVEAMKLGAIDFIEKPYQEKKLLAAIARGLGIAHSQEARTAAKNAARAQLQRLTERETQILQVLLAGMSNKVIARRLDLSPRTVEMHRANLMEKLEVASLSEAVRVALDGELRPLASAALAC
jgi:two-component system response regulator FixJ